MAWRGGVVDSATTTVRGERSAKKVPPLFQGGGSTEQNPSFDAKP